MDKLFIALEQNRLVIEYIIIALFIGLCLVGLIENIFMYMCILTVLTINTMNIINSNPIRVTYALKAWVCFSIFILIDYFGNSQFTSFGYKIVKIIIFAILLKNVRVVYDDILDPLYNNCKICLQYILNGFWWMVGYRKDNTRFNNTRFDNEIKIKKNE